MKRISNSLSLAALAALFAVSCSDTTPVKPAPAVSNYLDASIENYQTKTSLVITSGKGKTLWATGDQIKVFHATSGSETYGYDAPVETDASLGRFLPTTASSSFVPTAGDVAFFPASDSPTFASNVITANIPTTQAYVAGTFSGGSAPMVSNVFEDKTYKFKNVFGGVILNLWEQAGSTVTSIELSTDSTSGTILSGNGFQFAMSGSNVCTVTPPSSGGYRKVSMQPNVALSTDSTNPSVFCFMLPTLGTSEKVKVKITTAGYTYERSFTVNNSGSNVVQANKILNLATIEVGLKISFGVSVQGWDNDASATVIELQ